MRWANSRIARGSCVATCPLAVLAWFAMAMPARTDDSNTQQRSELLKQMRSLAEQTKVQVGSQSREAQLIANPVFRYDDQPRRFIDATMWIWTDGQRPVACQKIEAKLHPDTSKPQWGYCFTSLTSENLSVVWDDGRTWRSTEPGLAFQPLSDAPVPAERTSSRRRQTREFARQFSGRILQDRRTGSSTQIRLLPTPIFEHSHEESDVLAGAIFGFETNGTNPDVLVLFEVRGERDRAQWHFAAARMTGGITLNYRDQQIWDAPFVNPREGPFANWLFFPRPRTAPVQE
jgi:hypothetical protein